MAALAGVTKAGGLFNSVLETGVRSVVILNAAHPSSFDLLHLTWFDHLVVHTADVGGPESLHPDLPQRSGELLVRRRLVEDGVTMMRRLHLVEAVAVPEGIVYQASDEAASFVDLMRSSYARALVVRASWLAAHVCGLDQQSLEKMIAERVGKWDVEFQGGNEPGSGALQW
jgi:hypothetical protein